MSQAKYKLIADYIRSQINKRKWLEGFKIPSEMELSELFCASRMTARKAVDLLVHEDLLKRAPSIGTFVNPPRAQSSLLEIKNIKDEIIERGHSHDMVVLSKMTLTPNTKVAFELSAFETKVFKIVILHLENDIPIQLEERYVNAELIPNFLEQDFSHITSSEYLMEVAPLSNAKVMIEAIIPSKILKHHLKLDDNTACLKITRTTFSENVPVSLGYLYYPADKYRVTSQLSVN